MIIHYDTEKLNQLIKNVFDLTGISISVLDNDYSCVTRCLLPSDYCTLLQSLDGEKSLCLKSDSAILDKCRKTKAPECHVCRAGLCDYAMPIMKDNNIAGYIIMGRVRSKASPPTAIYQPNKDEKTLRQLDKLYKKLPELSETQLNALYSLLPSVVFSSAIKVIHNDTVSRVVEFIENNLHLKLCAELICRELHLSQSSLYREFRHSLNTSPNEYIIQSRIRYACRLLEETNLPVYTVAERSGIENYTYFCRLFKNRCGLSPSDYRKSLHRPRVRCERSEEALLGCSPPLPR